MNDLNKSREELIKELQELRQKYASLKMIPDMYSKDSEIARENFLIAKEVPATNKMQVNEVLDNLQDAFFAADIDGHFTYINSMAVKIFGYDSPDELLGKPAKELYANEEERDLILSDLRKLGKITDWNGLGLKKDGTSFYASMNVQFIKDEHGQIIGTQGVVRDITERKLAEKDIQQKNKSLEALLKISQSFTKTLNLKNVLQTIVDSATSLVELDSGAIYLLKGEDLYLEATTPPLPPQFPEEFRHSRLADHPHINMAVSSNCPVIVPDTRTADLAPIERAVCDSRNLRSLLYLPILVEERVIGIIILGTIGENTRLFSEYEISLYKTLAGQAAMTIENARLYEEVLGYIDKLEHDITERKKAENAFRESEERFSLFMDYLPAIVFIKDSFGRTLFVNKYMDDTLGASKWIGKTMLEVFPNEFGEKLISDDKKVMELGYQKIEEIIPHQDGTFHNYETQKFVLNREGFEPLLGGVSLDITERKQTEKALQEAKEVSEKYLNISAELILIIDPQGTIALMNDSGHKLLGYNLGELAGKNWFDTCIPNELRREIRNVFQCLMDGDIANVEVYENPVLTKSGINRLMLWHNSMLKDKDGNIIGLLCSASDITERKQAEKELLSRDEDLKESQRIAHLGSWRLDIANNEVTWSEELYKMYGFDPALPPPPYTEHMKLFTHESWELLSKSLANTTINGIPYDVVLKTLKEDGSNGWMWASGEALLDEKGKIVGLRGAAQDITERKIIEDSLRQSEEKLSTLFGTMTEMVVLHELVFNEIGEAINYRITDCNNAYTKVTGIKRENAIGKLASDVYQTEIAPYLDEFSAVAITGKPYEYTSYFAPMDKHFSISVVSPQKNMFATVTTDITAIQQIQKVISAKNEELENFLYISSHDLRTPLVNVQGFSSRLQKQVDSIKTLINECSFDPEIEAKIETIIEDSIPKTLNFIFTNITKMDVLINALLEISRTGRVKMTITKLNINQLIDKIIASLNFQITQLSVKVITHDLPDCYGDANLLSQLFTNILTNAIKYRNREKPLVVEISSAVNYNKVIYKIKDNGIGIEPKNLEKIWDVFYRIDPASPEAGDGIGLSIAKRIVDKHLGKIWVESEVGRGSIFSIELLTNEFSE